jgi:hypothetical protein
MYQMFQSTATERIPELNCSNASAHSSGNGLYYTFALSKVKTIDKLIVPENLKYVGTFNGCSNLENITFEGVIGNNISFADSSKLTNASVQSIIDCLKDLTGQTTQTLAVHQEVRNKMTPEQVDTIVNVKKWTLAPAASTN